MFTPFPLTLYRISRKHHHCILHRLAFNLHLLQYPCTTLISLCRPSLVPLTPTKPYHLLTTTKLYPKVSLFYFPQQIICEYRNNIGDRLHPCPTPCSKLNVVDLSPSISTALIDTSYNYTSHPPFYPQIPQL